MTAHLSIMWLRINSHIQQIWKYILLLAATYFTILCIKSTEDICGLIKMWMAFLVVFQIQIYNKKYSIFAYFFDGKRKQQSRSNVWVVGINLAIINKKNILWNYWFVESNGQNEDIKTPCLLSSKSSYEKCPSDTFVQTSAMERI